MTRALFCALLLAAPAAAQPDTTRSVRLAPVEVTAAPFVLDAQDAPLALSVRTRPAAERATEAGLSLEAATRGLPGVWVSDRGNAAVGERVLVRGTGWRAAFGVRGTHLLLDGVPLTLPDGQAQIGVVDPALITRVEAVRGPASTFWGSGSGGVLALSTLADAEAPRLTVRALGGAFGTRKAELAARSDLGAGRRLAVWGSAVGSDGYRDHGAYERWRGGLTASADLDDGRRLGVVALGLWMPRAEAPGGITGEAAADDPQQTRPIVLERDASKEVAQGYAALTYAQPVGEARLSAVLTAGARRLRNPIVPRYIALDRTTGGLRVALEGGTRLRWAVGAEAEAQRDDRLETSNVDGQRTDEVRTDQAETVRSGALFGRVALELAPALTATLAARGDLLAYRAAPAGASEDARTLGALSPSLGLAYRVASGRTAATFYANASGALDAPTTTELGNRPDGQPGFDPGLDPERTWGAELGARAARQSASGLLTLDAALFATRADDLLLPFEVDDVTFFRNEGSSRTVGAELAVGAERVRLGPGRLTGSAALTLARGTFTDGPEGSETPDGNRVPGFPDRLATWTLTWTADRMLGLTLGLDGEAASTYFADSANELRADAYAALDLRAGLRIDTRGATLTPFVSLRNATDARYLGSVVVNAFGGRFAEPAAERHLVAGLSVALR